MAWLSRVNFTASDVLSYTDLNNLGNDIRAWGGNVNGGGYTLSNVVLSASSGTMATVIGGTGTTSTLTLRSTSGVGTTGADIVFQTGNNGATEVMRLQNGGNVGIGTSSPSFLLDLYKASFPEMRINDGVTTFQCYVSSGVVMGTVSNHSIVFRTNATERMRIDFSGNVKIGGTADRATTAGAAHLDIFNGTAPAGTLANGISIYSSSGEAYVMDAAGNATLFSPHDRETNEWIFDSTDTRTGKRLKINVERLLRFINDHFGLDCVHDLMEEA